MSECFEIAELCFYGGLIFFFHYCLMVNLNFPGNRNYEDMMLLFQGVFVN